MSQMGSYNTGGGGAPGTVTQINGDTGFAIGPIINLIATPYPFPGGSVHFVGNNVSNIQLYLSDANANTLLGVDTGANTTSGIANTAVGATALNQLTTGNGNVALGAIAMQGYGTSNYNVAVGYAAMRVGSTGDFNIGIGRSALADLDTGNSNTAIGNLALDSLGFGSFNIGIGDNVGSGILSGGLTLNSNIYLNTNTGTQTSEDNTLRIGTATGTGQQELSSAYICGIDGVDLATAEIVTMAADQLGTTTLTAGAGISITPGAGIITIDSTAPAGIAPNYSVANATPFVAPADAYYITVDTSTIAITIELPNAPTLYQIFVIKDSAGNASVNNVTVTTVGGVLNLDAAPTFVMNTDWQAIQLLYDGFGYQIF